MKVKAGLNGEPAVIYELLPSVSAVYRNAAGVATPNSVTCQVLKITGSSAPVIDTTKTIAYITSASASETNSSTVSILNAQTGGLTWVEFRLYNESGKTNLLDRERIPILQEGQKGADGQQGDPAPHYLGKVKTPVDNSGTVAVVINGNSTQTYQAHVGDWVSYVGNDSDPLDPVWVKGMCVRWNGSQWVKIPIEAEGGFDSNPYMAAMYDLTENAPTSTFLGLLVKNLVAKTAMIEEIQAQLIQIKSAIFGGPRFTLDAQEQLIDNGSQLIGFKLGNDGMLVASGVEIQSPNFNGTTISNRAGYKYDNQGNVIINNLDTANLKLPSFYSLLQERYASFPVIGAIRGWASVGGYHTGATDLSGSNYCLLGTEYRRVININSTTDAFEVNFVTNNADERQLISNCRAISYWKKTEGTSYNVTNGLCYASFSGIYSDPYRVSFRIVPLQQNGQGLIFPTLGTNVVSAELFLVG